MREFTSEQLQQRFEQLPQEVQDAITSAEVHNHLVTISNKYGLHVDQEGELVDQVGLVMLGLSPSKDFVRNFSNAAHVKSDIASSIAEEINKEIFSQIRESMRAVQEKAEKVQEETEASNIGRAGDFTIEPHTDETDNTTQSGMESKDEMVAGIENPSSITTKQGGLTAPRKPINNTNDSALVDHLLNNATVSLEQKTNDNPTLVVSHKPKETTLQVPKKQKGSDPYREPIA